MFSQVSVCPKGLCLPIACWDTSHRANVPLGRHAPGQTRLWADTPLHSACWDTVNKWAVRILLKCILVLLVSITNLLPLKGEQKNQHCQLCVLRENSIGLHVIKRKRNWKVALKTKRAGGCC